MKNSRLYLWLLRFIGLIVPHRLRSDWRQEWEAELQWREQQLAEWDKLDWRNKIDMLRHSAGAFLDALWLQPKRWEDEMMQDIRFGVRMLRKHKGFAFATVFTLALGISANKALFSIVKSVLFEDSDRPRDIRWRGGVTFRRGAAGLLDSGIACDAG